MPATNEQEGNGCGGGGPTAADTRQRSQGRGQWVTDRGGVSCRGWQKKRQWGVGEGWAGTVCERDKWRRCNGMVASRAEQQETVTCQHLNGVFNKSRTWQAFSCQCREEKRCREPGAEDAAHQPSLRPLASRRFERHTPLRPPPPTFEPPLTSLPESGTKMVGRDGGKAKPLKQKKPGEKNLSEVREGQGRPVGWLPTTSACFGGTGFIVLWVRAVSLRGVGGGGHEVGALLSVGCLRRPVALVGVARHGGW